VSDTADPTALHVGDAAQTGARLVRQARRSGLPWDQLPLADSAGSWPGPLGRLRRPLVGGAWLARLAVAARRHDVVHVHSATTLPHTRPVARRFVLHCHGTDVRASQYEPGRGTGIRAGLRDAEAVLYSTPDLAEHVLPHRPDARLLPVPVDTSSLPAWSPVQPQRVVFASRWEDVKGLAAQLETARLVLEAVPDGVEVLGLDWGPAAAEAAALGVRLVPRLDHDGYLALLAGASAVVGQAAGILSSSELEALGSGAPLLVPTALPHYADAPPPVLGTDPASVAEAARALLDGSLPHDPSAGRTWVADQHGTARGVATLREVYRAVVEARR
jgi:hypothetical protein